MENITNILEFISTQLRQQMESQKTILNMLLDANKDMAELNKKLDKILEKYENEEETFECQNCHEILPEDEKGSSELALQDEICIYCMENGYGR